MAVKSVGGAGLDAAKLLSRSLLQPQSWPVGVYGFDGSSIADVSVSDSQRQRYSPLQHSADLFLSFACLYESRDFARSSLTWVSRHGLPVMEPAGDGKAPRSLRIEDLRAHAYRAWDTLVHYEAFINGEPARALYLPDGEPNFPYRASCEDGREAEEPTSPEQKMLELIERDSRTHARDRITVEINRRCYLRPLDKGSGQYPAFEWVWGFEDLLGAMYLRMMVLMERAMVVGRCKRCGTAFSEKKRVRNDSSRRRVFCSNACRVAYKRSRPAEEQ